LIKELLFIFGGIITGLFTGITPGIHANTIAFLIIYLPLNNSIEIMLFIVSMSVSHSVVDAIPNILLGCPSEESFLTILPGHQMLLNGEGLLAIRLTVFGGLITGIFAIFLFPIFFSFAQNYNAYFPLIIPAILLATIIAMILNETRKKEAIVVVLLSGSLGILVLNAGIPNAIFICIAGFFAIPSLLQSFFSETKIPKQNPPKNTKQKIKIGFLSALISGIISVFPAIGPSQAAFIMKKTTGKINTEEYLSIIGGINTGNLIFSLLMLYTIGKTRTGMASAINNINEISFEILLILICSAIISLGFSVFFAEAIAKKAIIFLQKINYKKINTIILTFISLLVFFTGGFFGALACISAIGISFFGLNSKIKRTHSMAFLMLPTMLFYLGITL